MATEGREIRRPEWAMKMRYLKIASCSGMLKGKVNIEGDVKYDSLLCEAPATVTFVPNASCRQYTDSSEADGE